MCLLCCICSLRACSSIQLWGGTVLGAPVSVGLLLQKRIAVGAHAHMSRMLLQAWLALGMQLVGHWQP